MNMLWESVKATGRVVGQAAVETGMKGKLQTELLLIKREVENRKRTFGEELYAYVEPLSKNPNFFAANDRMTDTIRGPLLTAQREVSALHLKRRKILDKITENDSKEKGAYINATTMLETVQNAAIKTGFVSVHAKLKAELAMVDTQIRDYQQLFGLEMYQILADLEDMEGWLPTVRDVRSIYDQARRDVEKIDLRRKEKEKELEKLGGVPMTTSSECSKYSGPSVASNVDERKKNEVAEEYFRQADPTLGHPSLGVPPVGEQPPLPSCISISTVPYSNRQSGTNFVSPQVQAAPMSAPLPYGSNSVTYQDPFARTFPAQSVSNGGNSAFGFISDGSQPSYSNGPAMGNGLASVAMQPAANGGTAFGFMTDDSQRSYGSGPGPAMGTGGNLILQDPFSPKPGGSNFNDPFAAFDSLQQSQQQPHVQTDNPLFRY